MASISKAEYLRKYLSGSDEKKKKKKRVKASSKTKLTSRVVDDDIDWKSLSASTRVDDAANALSDDGDDRPAVAEVHDDTDEARIKDMWVPVTEDEKGGRIKRHDSPEDLSPPRRKRHDSPEYLSPPRRKRHDSPEYLSPPRRKRHDSPEDLSPPRRKRHDSPEDLSPPRRKRHDSPEDLSPPRRKRHDSPEDLSPPRRKRHDSPEDLSPPRRKRHDSPEYLSPPRRKRHDSPEDLSPPRRKRHDSPEDLSPPRRKRHDSPEDLPPPRRKQLHQSDSTSPLWPCGSGRKVPPVSAPRVVKGGQGVGPEKMSSGAVAGLSSVEDMRRESARLRRNQAEVLSGMDPAASGKGAETVYRDKSGRRIDSKLDRLQQKELERKKEEELEVFMEWGRGVTQKQQAKEAVEDAVYEMSKPLARYRDDEDLERLQREQEREGDPMLAYLRSKKAKQLTRAGKKEKPSWQGAFPQNRFNMRPGYRWDGVDRSNGFEKEWFSREANSKAVAEMSYKWSVEDM